MLIAISHFYPNTIPTQHSNQNASIWNDITPLFFMNSKDSSKKDHNIKLSLFMYLYLFKAE
jgi:hypothetical protein